MSNPHPEGGDPYLYPPVRRVLLVEPYPQLQELFLILLNACNCRVDMVMTGPGMSAAIGAVRYDCVILNIDQGRPLDYGMELAEIASQAGSRIIMIPDHEVDISTIKARGWLHVSKPFKGGELVALIALAIGVEGDAAAIMRRASAHTIQAIGDMEELEPPP